MSTLENNIKKDLGFTIVELLVVIVVIGILAAITIVSYTGITSRANTASAQQAANNVISKVNVYQVDGPTQTWPTTMAALTGAASTTTYYLTGATFTGTTLAAAPGTPSTVNFQLCGTSGTATVPANLAAITVPSGNQVGYWNYSTSAVTYMSTGTVTGNYLTYPVACFNTAS